MAATRLSESQKQELVERFRAGESSQALADSFACSANTVSRVVKAAMEPAEYEQLKQQRTRRGAARQELQPASAAEPAAQPATEAAAAATEQLPLAVLAAEPARDVAPVVAVEDGQGSDSENSDDDCEASDDSEDSDDDGDAESEGEADDDDRVLAIDDADDFGADDEDDLDGDDEDGNDEDDDGPDAHDPFRPIPLAGLVQDLPLCEVQPLVGASLPASAWMLVDKVVELQPKPLRDFPELGRLPDDELDRQAIAVYANPRQAKRHCGRTQRVIKLPDLAILERTSSYLLAQGISRLVVEGSLYSLPGS